MNYPGINSRKQMDRSSLTPIGHLPSHETEKFREIVIFTTKAPISIVYNARRTSDSFACVSFIGARQNLLKQNLFLALVWPDFKADTTNSFAVIILSFIFN